MVIWKTYIKGKFFRKQSNNQRIPHGVKRVRIRSYSGPHFSRISRIRIEYVCPNASPNARKSGKNADKNNYEYGLFIHNATWT